MLTREGTSRGNEPTVQVLEIAANQQRKADDLLPYLSPFAQFYRSLPNNPKELILKRALIPLNDIECLTRTVIDIPEGVENLFKKKGNTHSLFVWLLELTVLQMRSNLLKINSCLYASHGIMRTGMSTTTTASRCSSSERLRWQEGRQDRKLPNESA